MLKIVITILLAVAALMVLIRLFERQFVYFPIKYPNGYWNASEFGLQVEDHFFQTSDGVQLHAWWARNDSATATMLWCHGNAGNLSHRIENLIELVRLPLNVFIFDYRGYGRSDGEPTESGLYVDALSAYAYLVNNIGVSPERLVIFGRSLGGAVAVDLATKRPHAGLILESTFTSARDMARQSFPFLPAHLVIKTKLNSLAKVSSIRQPILFLHGTQDRIVPYDLGKRLFETAGPRKEFYPIQGADHNDTFLVGGKPYFDKIKSFIEHVAH